MKKMLTSLFVLPALALLASCGGSNQEKSSLTQSSNNTVSSSESKSSSENAISSKNSTASSSSKNNTSSISSGYKDNELSTESGLVVKFNKTGAAIESIKWNNTQIAKDGFVVGRCANRIANGKFSIDGTEYSVSINSSPHSLHGGQGSGFNSWRGPFATKDWTKVDQTASSIKFSIESADGENGYPGKMNMTVEYTLSQAGELAIQYTATTTKDTLCNPTNHLYMNLNGSNAARNYNNIKLQVTAPSPEGWTASDMPTGGSNCR